MENLHSRLKYFPMTKPNYKIPVSIGNRLKLKIETLASSGDGLCRYEGYTIFVPTTIPGDCIVGEIIKTTPRFGVARIEERLMASNQRIKPTCPVHPDCGGCKLQDLPYDRQVEFKLETLSDTLKRLGNIKLSFQIQAITADSPYFYRNKASFAIQSHQKETHIGFYKQGAHEVVDSNLCDTLMPPINAVKEVVRVLIKIFKVTIYDETRHKGFLRGIVIRQSPSTGETLLGLVSTKGKFSKKFVEHLADKISKTGTNLAGIIQNINEEKTNVILGNHNRTIWGRDAMTDQLGDLKYQLSLPSFFQVNPEQTIKLYNLIREWTDSTPGLAVDAHCGVGGIALWLARNGRQVIGVDEVQRSVSDAIKSAEMNNISSCSFLVGTAERHLNQWKKKEKPTIIIFDPPRKGCSEELLESATNLKPKLMVYVSCNPATLARDLNRLKIMGYCMRDLRMIDMFPQTQHIEAAVLLTPK